jgi:phenylalanine-4-hydroxylase
MRSDADRDTWRMILDRSQGFLSEMHAVIHPDYLRGWQELALPADRIPTFEELNERLAPVGWRIVPVDGYIPVYEYVALLASRVFPAARVLRRREHIDYSPMPDMAHDLIGHLPMLFSPGYREYLRMLAVAMVCAEGNVLDHELYQANHDEGVLRGGTDASSDEIARARDRAARAGDRLSRSPSELTQLGRIYLWTIEFGLMGTRDDFKIYGSGLMSAPGEARSILSRPDVVAPYDLGAADHDIAFCDLQTRYFVASGYPQLHEILGQYRRRMSSWKEVDECNGSLNPRSWTRPRTPESTKRSTTAR